MKPFLHAAITVVLVLAPTLHAGDPLKPKLLERLRELVQIEIDGRSIDSIDKGKVRPIQAYTGTARTHDVVFTYELFPDLGMFRILTTIPNTPDTWLYMVCGEVARENIVQTSEEGQLFVDDGVRNKILSCASGILYLDITKVPLTCRRLDVHLLYSQKVEWMPYRVGAVEVLLNPQRQIMAITSGNGWKGTTGNRPNKTQQDKPR